MIGGAVQGFAIAETIKFKAFKGFGNTAWIERTRPPAYASAYSKVCHIDRVGGLRCDGGNPVFGTKRLHEGFRTRIGQRPVPVGRTEGTLFTFSPAPRAIRRGYKGTTISKFLPLTILVAQTKTVRHWSRNSPCCHRNVLHRYNNLGREIGSCQGSTHLG